MSDDIVVAAVRSIEYQNETGKSLRVAATHASRQKGITAQQTKVFHRAKEIKQSMTEETPVQKREKFDTDEEPAEYHFRKFMEAMEDESLDTRYKILKFIDQEYVGEYTDE